MEHKLSASVIPADDVLHKPQFLNPAQLWLRFYGRFLFVKSGTDVIVAAVNTCPSGGPDHKVFLTIREMNVCNPGITPSSRLVGTEIAPFGGALNVWSIDGCALDVAGQGGVTWPPLGSDVIPLADFDVLAKGIKVNQAFLDPNKPLLPPVTALIRIHEGAQFSFHIPTKGFFYEFVNAKDKTPMPGGKKQPLADMVQIAMALPSNGVLLRFDQTPTGGLGSSTPVIKVAPFIDPIVVISFSNLCSAPAILTGPDAGVDNEFAAYYKLLMTAPDPMYVPKLANGIARVPAGSPQSGTPEFFAPFGDCFLGAMASDPLR